MSLAHSRALSDEINEVTHKGSYARFTPLNGATNCLCHCGAAVENLAQSLSSLPVGSMCHYTPGLTT